MLTGYVRLIAVAVVLPGLVAAGEADVVDAEVNALGDGAYRFEATVRHDDAGWDHYADAWQVLTPDGQVVATRTLHHPHENEQPFTRSLGGVSIPEGVDRVRIRARDSRHGFGGAEVTVDVP